jgi:peptide/nickel transport system ATP-binding protein
VTSGAPLFAIEDLGVTFRSADGPVTALRNITLTIGGESLGIVGESGSGKTTFGRALIGLLPASASLSATRFSFDGIDLGRAKEREWLRLRGRRIAMIFQDPRFVLNAVLTVGEQVAEGYRKLAGLGRRQAREKTLAMLEAVGIRDPRRVYRLYPREVSGGMGQRIMIAMMLAGDPDMLVADEPTSSLDMTTKRQALALLDELVRRRGMTLVLISHDLDLVRRYCDRVVIMYSGRIVDICRVADIEASTHPYTRGLLACRPRLSRPVYPLPELRRDPAWLDIARDVSG